MLILFNWHRYISLPGEQASSSTGLKRNPQSGILHSFYPKMQGKRHIFLMVFSLFSSVIFVLFLYVLFLISILNSAFLEVFLLNLFLSFLISHSFSYLYFFHYSLYTQQNILSIIKIMWYKSIFQVNNYNDHKWKKTDHVIHIFYMIKHFTYYRQKQIIPTCIHMLQEGEATCFFPAAWLA